MDFDTSAHCPDGTLKDASEIEWIHSPSDEVRLPPPLIAFIYFVNKESGSYNIIFIFLNFEI